MTNSIKNLIKKTPFYTVYLDFKEKKFHLPSNLDSRHIWAFNAGETFSGNPKWLFLYISKYRPDIYAYWLCDNQETVDFIRSLGYRAHTFKERDCYLLQQKTGVFVVEQIKEVIPKSLQSAVMLNLYHGVGCKTVEKKVTYGFLAERIAKKFIKNSEYYQKNMLFLVSSPLMEEHFIKQCCLNKDHLIRAGYPRCVYQKYFEKVSTYDHDIRRQKGLAPDTKIAAYVPTYRDNPEYDFWENAIPDFEVLIQKLEQLNMLLLLKIHPKMEKDGRYRALFQKYGTCPRLLFWDNRLDFYEIFDQIDLGIIDYSSIFYDMMAGGVTHFIRYFFDYGETDTIRDMVFDLKEMTCGTLCSNFEQLLSALEHYEAYDEGEFQRINDLFWQYSNENSMETIIEHTLKFQPEANPELPMLYSFDIFDTLIARKVLKPEGIFYYVKEKMVHSPLNFPDALVSDYPAARMYCEENVREYYRKTLHVRKSTRREITFQEIFERMAVLYGLDKAQTDALMGWELEAEYENCIPLGKNIRLAEELCEKGETVLLISDMYLPKDFILRLLKKACPRLAELPLFLSSDLGVQKTTRKLFLEAYHSLETYTYKKWIHRGDNPFSDGVCPKKLGIEAVLHPVPDFNDYEACLVKSIGSYDAYLVAAQMARFRETGLSEKEYYAYAFISLYFVPYVHWAVHHAVKQGTQCVYFISRDGHHLKQIADVIIEKEQLPLKTRYIYGSRAAWRIPSFIEEMDDEFFYGFGNFAEVSTYKKLLQALFLTEEQFTALFPELENVKTAEYITPALRQTIISVVKGSDEYKRHLLSYAAGKRELVEKYFVQEIDFSESFAFIEYWGRGYTQDCFARLLHHVCGKEFDVPFYYTRSVYPTQGHSVRCNFSPNTTRLMFTEAIFSNIPYRSIEEYRMEEGKVVPVILPVECDMELHQAMETFLPLFTEHYEKLPLTNREKTNLDLYHFGLQYYSEHQDDKIFVTCLGPLVDAVMTYGDKKEFAPAITQKMIERLEKGEKIDTLTSSIPISIARSEPELAKRFKELADRQLENTAR